MIKLTKLLLYDMFANRTLTLKQRKQERIAIIMTATSTTYGSSYLYDSLVSKARESLGFLEWSPNPLRSEMLPTGVEVRKALIRNIRRTLDLHLYRKEEVFSFSCSVCDWHDLLLTIRSPGVCLNGENRPIWEFVAVLECEPPPWLKAACDASAIPDIYQSNDGPDFLHLIPEAERADPQSKFMECFLMNLYEELAR